MVPLLISTTDDERGVTHRSCTVAAAEMHVPLTAPTGAPWEATPHLPAKCAVAAHTLSYTLHVPPPASPAGCGQDMQMLLGSTPVKQRHAYRMAS
jgi:hypothetical protein